MSCNTFSSDARKSSSDLEDVKSEFMALEVVQDILNKDPSRVEENEIDNASNMILSIVSSGKGNNKNENEQKEKEKECDNLNNNDNFDTNALNDGEIKTGRSL